MPMDKKRPEMRARDEGLVQRLRQRSRHLVGGASLTCNRNIYQSPPEVHVNRSSHYRSISEELNALKDRVRHMIDDRHWLTDGEWKESVLRYFLRRHLPDSIGVGRGFVLTENGPTGQCDILLYDKSKPLLYRDNDLIFAPPDAIRGIIEVKTTLRPQGLSKALAKLCADAELVRHNNVRLDFVGLFSYDAKIPNAEKALASVASSVGGQPARMVQCICLGPSRFIRYWVTDPVKPRLLNKWHFYALPNLGPGYFIYNVVEYLCVQSTCHHPTLWFPSEGKEGSKVAETGLANGQ